jgi:modulator of FtsH protease HflK
MAIFPSWLTGAGIFRNDPPKSPWGNGGKGDGDDSSGGTPSGGGSGPRNPWSFPPEGKRGRPGGTLDDLLRRARRGGGGGGGGGGLGGGLPGLPGGARIWWLALGALVLVWLGLTSIHRIGPQERGVSTFLGRYSGTLGPGWQFTLPAPLQAVRTVDVQVTRDEKFPEGSGENLMLTGDQNIVDLAYQVQWNIHSAPDYVFQIAEPQKTVRATAETAMRAIVATTTLNDTIGSGRSRIEAQVLALMQQILDEYHSGVTIVSVTIQKSAAPQAVDEDFKRVTAAQQEAQANKNNANAYAQQVIAAAEGQAAEFDKLYEQYKLAPEVTRRRLYYETMESVLQKSDKVIVEAPGVTPYLPLPDMRRSATAPTPAPKGAAR